MAVLCILQKCELEGFEDPKAKPTEGSLEYGSDIKI